MLDGDWSSDVCSSDLKLAYATGVPLESAMLTDLGGLKVAVMRSTR
jgi:hypothetical protein